jgi:hypothetical protein
VRDGQKSDAVQVVEDNIVQIMQTVEAKHRADADKAMYELLAEEDEVCSGCLWGQGGGMVGEWGWRWCVYVPRLQIVCVPSPAPPFMTLQLHSEW